MYKTKTFWKQLNNFDHIWTTAISLVWHQLFNVNFNCVVTVFGDLYILCEALDKVGNVLQILLLTELKGFVSKSLGMARLFSNWAKSMRVCLIKEGDFFLMFPIVSVHLPNLTRSWVLEKMRKMGRYWIDSCTPINKWCISYRGFEFSHSMGLASCSDSELSGYVLLLTQISMVGSCISRHPVEMKL